MNVSELKRVEFADYRAEAFQERTKLAREASNKLGYKRLANAYVIPGALLGALRELEIQPLSTVSVEKYKASKAGFGMWDSHIEALVCVAIAVAFGLLAGVVGQHADFNKFIWPNVAVWVFGAAGVVSVVFAFIAGCTVDGRSRIERYWSNGISLENYEGAVPEFVLRKALQIQEACPGVSFTIDQLCTKRERTYLERDPDPFLVVTLGKEKYYIEVWDEKEYEATV